MIVKKHYIEFVKIFNKNKVNSLFGDMAIGKAIMRDNIITDFIDYLKSDNPNFDIDKFIKALL